jgi:hypothetical protein
VPPDEKGRPSVPEPRAGHHHRQSFTKAQPLSSDQHLQGNAAPRHIGRYANGWRDGFRAGAADALRVAGRRLPAETWHIIEALADQYELAAGDG